MSPTISFVGLSPRHGFSKEPVRTIRLVAGYGVAGDAHAGASVKHRSRVARDATQPNRRQVHLIHGELFAELAEQGLSVAAGDLGENITTQGIDLLALPRGTRLRIGGSAVVVVTGLRNPCSQLDTFRPGLMAALIGKDANGQIVRKAGIMGIVVLGGEVRPGDQITPDFPATPHERLQPV